MNTYVTLASLFALAAANDAVLAAEDHSQHRPPPSDPHGEHQSHAPAQAQPNQDSHAEHAHHGEHDHSAHESVREPGESERAHVPPDPPAHPMGDMSPQRMIELMQMEDDAPFGMLLLDQLEWQKSDDADALSWEFDAWYGDDYNKLWFETEGEKFGSDEEGRVELMWDRIVSPWWSVQAGLRHDIGSGPSRTWVDLGVQGTAPYALEIDAALYIGEEGRLAARFSSEYDVLITQRLVLQPEFELRAYGKDDRDNGIGSGLSDIELGLRLRYEIRREFAPYLGVHWERRFGRTADLARQHGEAESEVAFVAGIRAWF
jgi:copper resistance protein B